jgi:hypothetical protein
MAWTASKNPEIQAQWRQRLADWRESGLSVQRFASERDFSAPSLWFWRRWLEDQPQQSPAFVELKVEEEALAPSQDTMVVALCRGRLVYLRPGFDASSVARLVTTLEQL